jgi:hypothetical protein
MHIVHDSLTASSIVVRWRRSKGRLSSRANEMRPLDFYTRRTIKTQLPPGGWISTGSFMFSTYVSTGSVRQSLTASFQTELAINTHMMVSDLHRNTLTVQGGVDDQHRSVRAAFCPSTTKHLPSPRLKPGQRSRISYGPQSNTYI